VYTQQKLLFTKGMTIRQRSDSPTVSASGGARVGWTTTELSSTSLGMVAESSDAAPAAIGTANDTKSEKRNEEGNCSDALSSAEDEYPTAHVWMLGSSPST
jgi:hypothetical protein